MKNINRSRHHECWLLYNAGLTWKEIAWQLTITPDGARQSARRHDAAICLKCNPRPAKPPPSDCVHHWLLGDMHAGTSAGTCRKCGAERSFRDPEYSPFAITPSDITYVLPFYKGPRTS